MMTYPTPEMRRALTLLQTLLNEAGARHVAVRFWDGSLWKLCGDHPPAATIVLRHEDALERLLRAPIQLALGEAYIYGDIDIEGSIGALMPVADYLMRRRWSLREWLQRGVAVWTHRRLARLPEETRHVALRGRRHDKLRDKAAVRYHYDVPVEFYRLWLDSRLIYSCGYFHRPEDDLEAAQTQKLEYLCRKLRLAAGDRVLDIGCGWGGFALHAAAEHGAIVHGVTLSRRQAEVANERVAALGLARRCRIEVRDYRDVRGEALYDKIVSVGMVEHVGRSRLAEYCRRARQLLVPGGVFLNQGIGTRDGRPHLGPFADRYVFPDAELVPVHDVVGAAEAAGFEVRDVESLRDHYALTLEAWLRRLEQRQAEAICVAGEVTYRVWRAYLAMAAYLFRQGRLSVYQTLCVHAADGRAGLPLTREDWYERRSVAAPARREAA